MQTKRIICLYGGPGTGKSTTCAGLFYKLKIEGYNCEMNREYIKEWVWESAELAGQFDAEIKQMLNSFDIKYTEIDADEDALDKILKQLKG